METQMSTTATPKGTEYRAQIATDAHGRTDADAIETIRGDILDSIRAASRELRGYYREIEEWSGRQISLMAQGYREGTNMSQDPLSGLGAKIAAQRARLEQAMQLAHHAGCTDEAIRGAATVTA
jgi:hypothetical protein